MVDEAAKPDSISAALHSEVLSAIGAEGHMRSESAKNLPSGMVTFLFTDIEGSTRILRDLGELYSDILDLHHRLLREVWRRHDGVEVLTEGDAFFVAFADASNALAAAADAQRTLGDAVWPGDRPVLVRMGLHRGYARPVDDDYRALAVHQAARVVDAANGGQIFTTAEVVEARSGVDSLEVIELGRFRVRDFDEPVALFQISAPDLAFDSRPPRVRPAGNHNLIRPTTSLVDRVIERSDLAALVKPGALVTVLGSGGAGKTRLSVEVGFESVARWPDGVWLIELAPLTSGEDITKTIADAIHAPSTTGNDAWSDLVAHLEERSLLLILDNCEHLAEPVARLVHDLRQRCPNLGVLATSRVALGLLGESIYRVNPLGAADAESDAVKLYVERTGLGPDADLTDVVALCNEIDGLPLAIELAATRAYLLSPADMTERMRRDISVVSTRDPTVPGRQRSLDRLLDWSLELLGPEERIVLTRLAVVADGFDMPLAEAVAGSLQVAADRVPELVWLLVDWSLIRSEFGAGTTRYSLLSTVRSHVLQNADRAQVTAARSRLASALMERLGPGQGLSRQWVTQMGIDLENVRAVVALDEVSDEIARSLAWSIGQYHNVTASHRTAIAEIGRCIDRRATAGPDLVALLSLQADVHLTLGELAEAGRIADRAVALAEQVGVPPWDDTCVVRTQGELALRTNDPSTAARLAEEGLRASPGTPRGAARLWNLAALARHALGDVTGACAALEQGLRAEVAAGLDTFLANTHGNFAEALMELGDPVGAAKHQLAALDYARSMGQRVNIAFSCMVAARFALEEGAAAEAVRIQTGADVILDREGFSLYEADEQQRVARIEAARATLGQDAFERARADGRSAPVDQLADQTAAILRRRAASP